MAKGSSAAAELAKLRWRGTTKKERSEQMSEASAKRWADMTEEERSAEMSRRRKLGWDRRKKR